MGTSASNFRGRALLLSEKSTPERNTLILGGDKRTLHIIISTAVLEVENWTVYRKSKFMFRDAAPDTDQQLIVRKGQCVYTLDGTDTTSQRADITIPWPFSVSYNAESDEMEHKLKHRISARRGPDPEGFVRIDPLCSVIDLHPGNSWS